MVWNPGMDLIFIRDLCVETCIGVYPQERQALRPLLIDLELGADLRPAAATDCLDDTVNYQAVAQRIIEFTAVSNCQLLETLGERLAELLLQEFQLPWLRLTLRKPAAIGAAREVGITIERRNSDAA